MICKGTKLGSHHTHDGSMGPYNIFNYTWMVNVYGFHVGQIYTIVLWSLWDDQQDFHGGTMTCRSSMAFTRLSPRFSSYFFMGCWDQMPLKKMAGNQSGLVGLYITYRWWFHFCCSVEMMQIDSYFWDGLKPPSIDEDQFLSGHFLFSWIWSMRCSTLSITKKNIWEKIFWICFQAF